MGKHVKMAALVSGHLKLRRLVQQYQEWLLLRWLARVSLSPLQYVSNFRQGRCEVSHPAPTPAQVTLRHGREGELVVGFVLGHRRSEILDLWCPPFLKVGQCD